MRYLGLDVGRARIGLALADDVLRTARAHRTILRHGDAADLDAIAEVAAAFEVTRAVVGLPLNMDGTEGGSARLARAFAAKLEQRLGLPVELHDERLSTFEASTRLREQGLSARDQKGVIDAEAAAVILQGWLDGEVGVKRVLRVVMGLLAVVVVVAGVVAFLLWRQVVAFSAAPFGSTEEKVVEVPPGATPRAVVRALARAGVLSDAELAWRYVRFVKRDPRQLKTGEYAFAGPLTPDEALERIYKGEVRLYRFTVPEGVRLDDIAEIVGRSSLAPAESFLLLAHSAAEAHALGIPADDLEGYLFPDTYAFARGVSARQILESMVRRALGEYERADATRSPNVKLDRAEVMTLASIIEKETGQPAERPRISCVFHNRLARKIRLQTDPTVMYATYLRTGHWSKNISRADLQVPHPYNTYTSRGLPPGPIASPGAASIQAALAPLACNDLFFVSRNDGTHVFCPDLACHERAVKQWQVDFFRRRRP